MFNHHDITRNACMLRGPLAHLGYDWWWHSFTAQDEETGEDKAFFIEYFICNPALGEEKPVLGQLPENKAVGKRPSYLMVKAGTWGEDHCQLHRFFGWKKVHLHPDGPYRNMLLVNYEAPDGTKKHNRLWNGGNGWGTVRLFDKKDGELTLVDEIEATHIGCEYGEYGQ